MESRTIKNKLIVSGFLIIITLPVILMLFKSDFNKRPHLSFTYEELRKFPLQYTEYFNDNFGLRTKLLEANFIIKYYLLNTSPSAKVILGNDGWLFNASEGEKEDYLGTTNYNQQMLDNLAFSLEAKRIWLGKKGIKYLFIIAPNKTSIYGEYVKGLRKISSKDSLDDVVNYLKLHTKVNVIDLRQVLRENKKKGNLYYKLDTHWNRLGAFIGYQKIMETMSQSFNQITPYTLADYNIHHKASKRVDLSRAICGNAYLKESAPVFEWIKVKSSRQIELIKEGPYTYELATRKQDATLPKAIVFRDSFFTDMAPYFSEHFRYVKYYWQYWGVKTPVTEIINTYKPNIVVEEILERYLKFNIPDFKKSPPEFIANEAFRNARKLFSLTTRSITELECNKEVTVDTNEGRILLDMTGNDPQIFLPKLENIEYSRNKQVILKIEGTSDIDTTLQIFYKTSSNADYSEEASVKYEIKNGKNSLYCCIPAEALNYRIRIDPSMTPGKISIDKFEVRLAAI